MKLRNLVLSALLLSVHLPVFASADFHGPKPVKVHDIPKTETRVGAFYKRSMTLLGYSTKNFPRMKMCRASTKIWNDGSVLLTDCAEYALIAKGNLFLASGNMLYAPQEESLIVTPTHRLTIKKDAVALIHLGTDGLAVLNVQDNATGSIRLDGRPILPGQAVALGATTNQASAALSSVNTTFRKIVLTDSESGRAVVSGEFSHGLLMLADPLVRRLRLSQDPSLARVASRVERTAACLMVATAKHGEFSKLSSNNIRPLDRSANLEQ